MMNAPLSLNHLLERAGQPFAGNEIVSRLPDKSLRLSPDQIGWIAGDAQDRFLVVDDVLLPLYRQFAALHRFEKVIVFAFSGAPCRRNSSTTNSFSPARSTSVTMNSGQCPDCGSKHSQFFPGLIYCGE